MNQLPNLIEYLLLNHDYVVMPGVGTFIVQQMDARWNDEEEAFLPPYRSVRFNAELTQGDDLLLDTIGNIYKTSRDQSAQMLTTWVDDFEQLLDDEGYAEFGAIGAFSKDEGVIAFKSNESGVTTPDYYGLDAFHFGQIEPYHKAKIVPMTASMEADSEAITIRINRNIANIVVAACAAILLFMVFSLPAQDNADQLRSSLRQMLVPSVTLSHAPAASSTTEQPSVQTEAPAPHPEAAPQTVASQEYCIVLASAIPMSNARKYVETLTERGFLSARVEQTGHMVRVVVGHYPTEEAAQQGARDIRSRSDEYSGAWVMQL